MALSRTGSGPGEESRRERITGIVEASSTGSTRTSAPLSMDIPVRLSTRDAAITSFMLTQRMRS